MSPGKRLAQVAAYLVVLTLPANAQSQRQGEESQAPKAPSVEARNEDGEAVPSEPDARQPCSPGPSNNWLESTRHGVEKTVCATARWFDRFFGDKRAPQEQVKSWGRLITSTSWNESDGFEPDVRLRAHVVLPRLESRLQAVFGREEPDTFVKDVPQDETPIPEAFLDVDREWLTGLEYKPVRGDRHDVSFGGGVRVRSPLDPYVRMRYRYQAFPSDRWLFRSQLTPFWRNSEGFGVSSNLDVDRVVRPTLLLRHGARLSWSEESEGLEWRFGPTLYQHLGDDQAMAYRIEWRGATDADVPLERYGIELVFRQRLYKDWLHLLVEPRVDWRRESLEDDRHAVPGLGLGFDMRFGSQ